MCVIKKTVSQRFLSSDSRVYFLLIGTLLPQIL